MERVFKEMPKIELHAHLNGSITDETCLQLIDSYKKEGNLDEELISLKNECTLQRCFEKFAQIHRLIQTTETLKWITVEVIRNFARDNVVYLELRTTPKAVHQISSKVRYIQSVIDGILECEKLPINVKLLLSIDRKMGFHDGDENVNLALNWSKKYPNIVVGIDLSGDPRKGSSSWIITLLNKAKTNNLKVTCHLPEVCNPDEARKFLEFAPNRVGHGLYLHPDHGGNEELWQLMKLSSIPMEICITSNVIAGIVFDVEQHHVRHFYLEKLPHVICTDDCGIFNTTLSEEYNKYLKSIGNISTDALKQLCLATTEYIFGSEKEKQELKDIIETWWQNNADWIKSVFPADEA